MYTRTSAVLRCTTGWRRRRDNAHTHTRCCIPFGLAPIVFKRRWPAAGVYAYRCTTSHAVVLPVPTPVRLAGPCRCVPPANAETYVPTNSSIRDHRTSLLQRSHSFYGSIRFQVVPLHPSSVLPTHVVIVQCLQHIKHRLRMLCLRRAYYHSILALLEILFHFNFMQLIIIEAMG